MIPAIMIGRKGSTGFPGKNTCPIMGRALCTYPLMAAQHAAFVDQIFISTDDEIIVELSEQYNAQIIERPPELATTEALGEDVFVHAYKSVKESIAEKGDEIELLVLLMANAATILADTIDAGILQLRQDPEFDSAVSVSKYNMWAPLRARKIDSTGCLQPFVPFEAFGDPEVLNCDRDSGGDAWYADMGVSIVRPKCLERIQDGLLPQKWMGRNIYPLKQWGGCDVDFEWQIPGVEFWLRQQGFTSTQTPYD